MKQAIRRALIESGILDVLANDPGTLLVATAKDCRSRDGDDDERVRARVRPCALT